MNPSSEVQIPEWLEGAMKPFLKQSLDRYAKFAKKGSNRMGDDFWKNNMLEVMGPSSQERRAGRIAGSLNEKGRGDMLAARRLGQRAMQSNQFLDESGRLLMGGEGSNLRESDALMRRAGRISEEQVTGKNLGQDPAIAQARSIFSSSMLPMIQNQAAMAGLGKSSALTNAASAGQAQYMLPLIQGGLGREERGIDRRYSDAFSRSNALFGKDMSRAGALQQRGRGDQANLMQGAGFRQGLGGDFYNRAVGQMNALQQQGSNLRGIRQDRNDSRYNDVMRRMGAYENALQGPLGMVGGMMGSGSSKF